MTCDSILRSKKQIELDQRRCTLSKRRRLENAFGDRTRETSAASRCSCSRPGLLLPRNTTTQRNTGKVAPFVPPPEGGRLHLSQAVLVPPKDEEGGNLHCLVFYRARGEGSSGEKKSSSPELALAALRCGGGAASAPSSSSSCDNVPLDLIFDEYTGEIK
jgi:hypothetical protein